ncbi:GNAT family N-acetyltransferase [Plantibacter sp. YIM 135249]|uniref:GNAT family N-acetyltransferase n=1 Tax=Plantibacter sp. YIM 135249 TaxID=3423918 RepID=UPI003D3561CF
MEPTDGVRDAIELRVRFAVDDAVLTRLHERAFGASGQLAAAQAAEPVPWAHRLERHSVAWIGAFEAGRAGHDELVGFVHAVWDGGEHAFLLDTIVDPSVQRRGIGRALVLRLREVVAEAGCSWLHVDFEPRLSGFYRECGFRPTEAGLLRLG